MSACISCNKSSISLWRAANKKKEAASKTLWEQTHRDKVKKSQSSRLYRYGITQEIYTSMLNFQNGKCSICETPLNIERKICIDHDYETGLVRSILCSTCNTGLGMFKDNPSLLRVAANYIEYYKENKNVAI